MQTQIFTIFAKIGATYKKAFKIVHFHLLKMMNKRNKLLRTSKKAFYYIANFKPQNKFNFIQI